MKGEIFTQFYQFHISSITSTTIMCNALAVTLTGFGGESENGIWKNPQFSPSNHGSSLGLDMFLYLLFSSGKPPAGVGGLGVRG